MVITRAARNDPDRKGVIFAAIATSLAYARGSQRTTAIREVIFAAIATSASTRSGSATGGGPLGAQGWMKGNLVAARRLELRT